MSVKNGLAVNRLPEAKAEELRIQPLRQAIMSVRITGQTPLKCLRFSQKSRDKIIKTQSEGEQSRTKKKREPKNFHQDYLDSQYKAPTKGKKNSFWLGINASGVRNALIETCRMAGFTMTRAKMSIFCEAEDYDYLDRTPLIQVHGKPEMTVDAVRNASGVVDQRARTMWPEWSINLRIRFDEDQFSPADVLNLLMRAGAQNGLGEGRPNSKMSCGTGNGLFGIDQESVTIERL